MLASRNKYDGPGNIIDSFPISYLSPIISRSTSLECADDIRAITVRPSAIMSIEKGFGFCIANSKYRCNAGNTTTHQIFLWDQRVHKNQFTKVESTQTTKSADFGVQWIQLKVESTLFRNIRIRFQAGQWILLRSKLRCFPCHLWPLTSPIHNGYIRPMLPQVAPRQDIRPR